MGKKLQYCIIQSFSKCGTLAPWGGEGGGTWRDSRKAHNEFMSITNVWHNAAKCTQWKGFFYFTDWPKCNKTLGLDVKDDLQSYRSKLAPKFWQIVKWKQMQLAFEKLAIHKATLNVNESMFILYLFVCIFLFIFSIKDSQNNNGNN